MPIQAKPLFRADVLRPKPDAFKLPNVASAKPQALKRWRDLIDSARIDKFKETEILPDFISEVFQAVLGFESPVQNPDRYTIRRENLIAVDGKRADAAFGNPSTLSNVSTLLRRTAQELPIRMPVRKTNRPPITIWNTAEASGVSMKRCRIHEITANSTRTTPTATAVAVLM